MTRPCECAICLIMPKRQDLLAGKEKADLACNRVLELALVRLVEIVGEAANRLPIEDQSRYPSIPWKEIVGMRNRLVHGYDAIDLDVLWDTPFRGLMF